MDPSHTHSHTAALIGMLSTIVPPGLVAFVAPPGAAASGTIRDVGFRFSYRDLPCTAIIALRDRDPVLRLAGDFGPLPYTVEGAPQRRRLLQALAAATSDTGLDWHLSPSQAIVFTGDIALPQALTPSAMVAGVVRLLLRADAHIGLMLEILGETGRLISPQEA